MSGEKLIEESFLHGDDELVVWVLVVQKQLPHPFPGREVVLSIGF
jgi:hypothetical protein